MRSAGSKQTPYNGLLVDVLTLIRADQTEKRIALECMNNYPSTQLKWDAKSKNINLLLFSQAPCAEAESSLQMFIEERCRPFAARSLRAFGRKNIFLKPFVFSGLPLF
jgi:hypothetical protein